MAEYICRDKATELIQPRVKPSTVYGEGYLQAIKHASEMLALMPAADVQPVKHGQWLPKIEDIYEFSECSECGNMESCETPYCAQCGARMDGDAE